MSALDEVLALLDEKPPEELVALEKELATTYPTWCENEGPQAMARASEADELFYGGEAGGGKSDLIIGLSLTDHHKSLILRRVNDDAKDLALRAREIAGPAAKYNGQDKILQLGDHWVRFVGCQFEDDKERFKGRPHDLYGFDEISDFTESQYKFITTWNRSAVKGQRCRVVCAGNPPTRPEGLWVLRYWAAWLDDKHPNPAKPGELRWYIRGENDEDVEVDGRGPHEVPWDRKPLYAKSRTFIPAGLKDNPDLAGDGEYERMLDSLPAALKAAYRDGNFRAELKDDEWQLIPTAWVLAAMSRWTPDGWREHEQTTIACDPAGGGQDAMEIMARHHGWFGHPVTIRGPETADGNRMAGRILMERRAGCPIVLDTGGGYGGAIALRLKDNDVDATPFNGAEASAARTNDAAALAFVNKRAEAYWRMREALDPTQEGGSIIALPPDDELKADLCSVHWELTRSGVKLESKDKIRERIGRSPGKGDVAVLALSEGNKAVKRREKRGGRSSGLPQVNRGYATVKQRYS
jgi:hypothetical protein